MKYVNLYVSAHNQYYSRYTIGEQYDTGAVTGYSADGAPGRIAFTLGGTGYQTGPSVAGHGANWRSSAASK